MVLVGIGFTVRVCYYVEVELKWTRIWRYHGNRLGKAQPPWCRIWGSKMTYFRVGQKVEFINGKGGVPLETWFQLFYRILHPYQIPQEHTPYTICSIYLDCNNFQMLELLEFPEL